MCVPALWRGDGVYLKCVRLVRSHSNQLTEDSDQRELESCCLAAIIFFFPLSVCLKQFGRLFIPPPPPHQSHPPSQPVRSTRSSSCGPEALCWFTSSLSNTLLLLALLISPLLSRRHPSILTLCFSLCSCHHSSCSPAVEMSPHLCISFHLLSLRRLFPFPSFASADVHHRQISFRWITFIS